MTRKWVRLFFGVAIVLLASGSSLAGTIVFSDDFESGNLNQWAPFASPAGPLTISIAQNQIPVGGLYSAQIVSSLDRMYRNLGSEVSGHILFTSYLYDDTQTRAFTEIRAYSGAGFNDGALQQLLAIGKYSSVTMPGEVYDGTKYQGRVVYPSATMGWFNLNGSGSPSRAAGWHRFDIEVMPSGTDVNFYVDGILGRAITGAIAATHDCVVMGSVGAGSTVANAWVDGVQVEVTAPAAYYKGIDVSKWQGVINWPQVHASGISFSFVKATEGYGYTDPKFQTNIEGAHGVGILAGPYHFGRPDLNPNGAADEAEWFVQQIRDYLEPGYLRPVLDLEKGAELGKSALSAWVCSFTARVKELTGVETIIYCNTNYAKNYLNSTVADKDLWIANWTYDTSQLPGTGVWSSWDFWQWSNQGSVPGISAAVDLDVCRTNPAAYTVPPPIPGDANRDDKVTDQDAAILAAHWRQASGATWADGDFNGDHRVNDLDASILAAHWHAGTSTAVPEPAAWVLLLAAALLWPLAPRRPER